MNLFGVNVEEETTDKSFESYFSDMEKNYIKNTVKESIWIQDEKWIQDFLKTATYSIEKKNINGFDAIIHKRNFGSMIGQVHNMMVFVGWWKILYFSADNDYHDLIEKIYSSVRAK